jgi:hypothetical protein
MTASDELKDPWGWLVAAVSGGVGWAALAAPLGPLAIPVGLGIGAAVLGTKVALGSRSDDRDDRPDRASQLPKPPRGSPQAHLLARAERAQQRINALADNPGDDWLDAKMGRVDDEVSDVVHHRLADLAGRVTVVDNSLVSAQPQLLRADYDRTAAAVAAETDPALRAERQRALDAMSSQIGSVDRLVRLRETLLTRMQTAVVGLEGLGSRMGELVALGADPVTHDRSAEVLAELTSELDTVRSGLAEAEALSRDV